MIIFVALLSIGSLSALTWLLFALVSRNAAPLIASVCASIWAWNTTGVVLSTLIAGAFAAFLTATLFETAAQSRGFRAPAMALECTAAFTLIASATAFALRGETLNPAVTVFSFCASGLVAALVVFRTRAIGRSWPGDEAH